MNLIHSTETETLGQAEQLCRPCWLKFLLLLPKLPPNPHIEQLAEPDRFIELGIQQSETSRYPEQQALKL